MTQKEFYKTLNKILEQMETKLEDYPDDINALLGDVEQWITTSSKIIAIISWIVLYAKRIIRGDINIFGSKM